MDEESREYDLRQLRLILAKLSAYQQGSVPLWELIPDLEALSETLKCPSTLWREKFSPAWGTLDEVLAVMMDEGWNTPDELGRRLIAEAINDLERLASEEIQARIRDRASEDD